MKRKGTDLSDGGPKVSPRGAGRLMVAEVSAVEGRRSSEDGGAGALWSASVPKLQS